MFNEIYSNSYLKIVINYEKIVFRIVFLSDIENFELQISELY